MNKNIGSMVSWRTKFAVAAVAFASVFTAWGEDIIADYLNLGTAKWDVWTAASKEGKAVDYDRAIVYFLGADDNVIGTVDTSTADVSVNGTTIVNYRLTDEWWNNSSASIDKYYVEVYSDGTVVGETKRYLPFAVNSYAKDLITTIGSTSVYMRSIDLGSYAVPEPTSGLLLLLGVAGLALKRRRQVA